MPNRRLVTRVLLLAVLLSFVSAGPIAQREARANCFYPTSYYTQYYRLITCHGEGCVPQREIVGEAELSCDGTYTSWGSTTCGGLTRCETTYYECTPICE